VNRLSTDPGYGHLKDHLIALTGLAFYTGRDTLLSGVIDGRLSSLGFEDCRSYAAFLADGEKGEAELETLIAQLTIGETSFFRDEAAFLGIRDTILPDILQRNDSTRQLRIWSAGCSTGAEPYSLAILLSQQLASRADGWQIDIHATDLNRDCLIHAAQGKFRKWALRCTSDAVRRECFSSEDGLIWTIHPRYKQWISFHHMNLVEDALVTPWPEDTQFDLILCRNVMIYFSAEARSRLVGQLHQSLNDSGWLVVGASEQSLVDYAIFRTVRAKGVSFYQRTKHPPGQPDPPAEPEAPLAGLPSKTPPTTMERLRALADRGDWQAAAEYSRKMLKEDRLNPGAHFYQALIFENLGIEEESQRSLRQAIYLDRNFALAHYHLGLILKRQQQTGAAVRSFGNVLNVLAGKPDDAIVREGSGITVTGLIELAKLELETSGGV
jgi:chemotaxis protein methyltransferase CheR